MSTLFYTSIVAIIEGPIVSLPCHIIYTQHAQTEWNVRRWNQSHTDTTLNARGEAMAAAFARALANEPIDGIYTSDLQRAIRTAAPLATAKGLGIVHDPRLRERRSSKARPTTEHPVLDWPTASETEDELRQRMQAALHDIVVRHPGQTVLVVSHGSASRCFLGALLQTGAAADGSTEYAGRQTAINRLEYHDGQWRIISLNDISHLADLEPASEDPNAG